MAGNLIRPKNVSEAQWQKAVELYDTAKRKGDRYPELTVAQAALETGWFKSPSGQYNYFGQKASSSQRGSIKSTQEVSGNKAYRTNAKFRDYDSIDEAVTDRINKWGKKYANAENIDEAIGSIWQYDPKTGSGRGYATDNQYGSKLKSILGSMGVSTTQENAQPNAQVQEEQFTLKTNKGELETAGEYKEPKEVSEAKQELVQAQNEENFVKELEQLGQQEQQVVEQEQFNYLQTPELFTVSDPQIQYTDQQPVMYAQEGGQIPVDSMGMWKYPNRTVIVPSGDITMSPNPITGESFTHNILAISEQTGEQRILKPNTNHRFKQTTSVKEIPLRNA